MFSRLYAKELIEEKVTVRIADTNREAINLALMNGIPTFHGNAMSAHAERSLDSCQYGTVLMMPPYKQLNPWLPITSNTNYVKEPIRLKW